MAGSTRQVSRDGRTHLTGHDSMTTALHELIGHECSIEFLCEPLAWPIPGYPARATVQAVDMPFVKLDGKWVNAALIKTIRASAPSTDTAAWQPPGPVTVGHPLECLIVLPSMRQSDGDWWAAQKFFGEDEPLAWAPDTPEVRAALGLPALPSPSTSTPEKPA